MNCLCPSNKLRFRVFYTQKAKTLIVHAARHESNEDLQLIVSPSYNVPVKFAEAYRRRRTQRWGVRWKQCSFVHNLMCFDTEGAKRSRGCCQSCESNLTHLVRTMKSYCHVAFFKKLNYVYASCFLRCVSYSLLDVSKHPWYGGQKVLWGELTHCSRRLLRITPDLSSQHLDNMAEATIMTQCILKMPGFWGFNLLEIPFLQWHLVDTHHHDQNGDQSWWERGKTTAISHGFRNSNSYILS